MVNWALFVYFDSQTKFHYDEIKTSSKIGGKKIKIRCEAI